MRPEKAPCKSEQGRLRHVQGLGAASEGLGKPPQALSQAWLSGVGHCRGQGLHKSGSYSSVHLFPLLYQLHTILC